MGADACARRKLVVVGVGLIGGSFALALQACGKGRAAWSVSAAAATISTRRGAWRSSIGRMHPGSTLDRRARRRRAGAAGHTGWRRCRRCSRRIAPHSGPAHDRHRRRQHQAGRDRRGAHDARQRVAALRAGTSDRRHRALRRRGRIGSLFRGRRVVLTPLPETAVDAQQRVARLLDACGGVRQPADAERHDRSSPRSAICRICWRSRWSRSSRHAPIADDYFRLAATGFRDFTRLAGSHPEMWRDICIAQRDCAARASWRPIGAELDRTRCDARCGRRRRSRWRSSARSRCARCWLADLVHGHD